MEEPSVNLSEKAKHDLALINRALKGNQLAYTEILHHYKDSIYYMILKMVSDPLEAEDLTIEAFGKAFKKLDQYEPTFAFSTWLFKIATNNTIDFLRKKRMKTFSLDEGFTDDSGDNYYFEIPSGGRNPEAELIRNQNHRILNKVVQSLKPRYRKLIMLRYFDELSYDEIAEELQLPIGTVKAQLFRAKEMLHSVLEKKEDK